MAHRFHPGPQTLTALLLAAAATCAAAQVMQPPGTLPNGQRINLPPRFQQRPQSSTPPQSFTPPQSVTPPQSPQQAAPLAAARPASSLTAPSLLDKPAEPAKIAVNATGLSVKAENSSLTQILNDISSSTGMTVEGLSKDQRVFGVYGPANPREVLSSLLQDSGYNVMMVGANPQGAPRQLFLTPRDSAPVTSGPQPRQPQAQEDDADDEPPQQPNDQNPPLNGPPEQNQPGVRTPQQMLQELQRIRQQQNGTAVAPDATPPSSPQQ